MKKTFSTILILSSALLFAGCVQNQSAAPQSSEKTEQSESSASSHSSSSSTDSQAKTESSASEDSNASADSGSSSSQTDKSEEQNSSDPEPAADVPAAPQETAQSLNSSISETLARAYRDSGCEVGGITSRTSDTGNIVSTFIAQSSGESIAVYVTTAVGNDPSKTFEMNTADDQQKNMAVMNEWTDHGNTVRVVRNNRSNINYVEVLDTFQQTAIHIEDNLSEQLPVTLNALSLAGYPAQQN